MARPEKISPEIIYMFGEYVAQGFTFDRASRNCGIAVRTFHDWMRKGNELDVQPLYKSLVSVVKAAAEYSEDEALQQVRSAAMIDRNWKAAAWFLERRFPARYGRERDHSKSSDHMKSGDK